ncbi:hypothetical protein CA51_02230 [Rosistilla oblonga]|uniref:Tetratricopeptide repeat protein n=1 Tax=Rosistilla oblonga TaxID=2527990 RepID=A0A518IMG1_9BACT|nr:hypothetical protein [Rosistilla oblonga]QDV10375.1 hypothetical protein CA51_02230 [Rosistilla oblonga]QDV54282.1 hypothetical protein Mal33_02320 [Rosistilla oblonga]
MPLSHYVYCMWPGLPEIWFRGRMSGLPAAICFAIAINTLLVSRFIYPQWLEPLMVRSVCWAFVGIWVVLFVRAVRGLPMLLAPRHASGEEDRYDAARTEFLKGRWFEAEALLVHCLEVDPRDALSLLLLASVYRKTDRFAAAAQTLDALAALETGDAWWLERDIEERRLKRMVDDLVAQQEDSETEEESESPADSEGSQTADAAKASSSTEENRPSDPTAEVAESPQMATAEGKSS